MKFSRPQGECDAIDRSILSLLQDNCKRPLAAIGEKVGLSAPAVVERIHKLEEAGVITGYSALLDARRLGVDVTAFIGVASDQPRAIGDLEARVAELDEVQECHHVTGQHTLLVKVKTRNTESLEDLIERVRALPGVSRTETMVVLSTSIERMRIALGLEEEAPPRAPRRSGGRSRRTAREGEARA